MKFETGKFLLHLGYTLTMGYDYKGSYFRFLHRDSPLYWLADDINNLICRDSDLYNKLKEIPDVQEIIYESGTGKALQYINPLFEGFFRISP